MTSAIDTTAIDDTIPVANTEMVAEPIKGNFLAIKNILGVVKTEIETLQENFPVDGSVTLEGEVTGSGTGTITTTVSNDSVIGKLLTGFSSATGTVSDSDNILSAFQKIVANLAAIYSTVNTWTKAQRVSIVSLSSTSASITIDLSLSNNFSHTLTENTTLANPSNIVAGQSGQITITQHASAAKTLAFGSYWKSSDGTTPALSTTVDAINLLTYYVNSSSHITFSLIKHGVA